MIVVMRTGADRSEIEAVKQAIRDVGLEPYPVIGEERTVIAVVGADDERARPVVVGLPGVLIWLALLGGASYGVFWVLVRSRRID